MKTTLTSRTLTLVLAFVLLFSLVGQNLSLTAFAANDMKTTSIGAEGDYLDVIVDRAPIRTGASENDPIVVRCAKNAVIRTTGSVINGKLHRWYKTDLGYIYSGNVQKHKHDYIRMVSGSGANQEIFEACSCGAISVTASKANPIHNTLILGGVAAAGISLYTGNLVAAAVSVGVIAAGTAFPAYKMAEINWDKFVANKAEYCYADSVHMVIFNNGQLCDLFQNNISCFDANTSFVYTYAGGDVWVSSENVAREIAGNPAGNGYISGTYNGYSCYTPVDADNNTCGHILYGGAVPVQQ